MSDDQFQALLNDFTAARTAHYSSDPERAEVMAGVTENAVATILEKLAYAERAQMDARNFACKAVS